MTIFSAAGLAIAMFILAASPGPGVLATVARALSSGFRPALAVIAGIVMGDIIFLLLATFGLSIIAHVLGDLFFVVKFVGGAYLIWLGVKIWLNGTKPSDGDPPQNPPTPLGNFTGGLLITLSNPKVILFYCGFLPTFMDLSVLTAVDLLMVVMIVSVVLAGVLTGYAFLASRARELFSDRKSARRLDLTAGGVMIGAGVAIASRS